MAYDVVTDNDKSLGQFNMSAHDDMDKAVQQYGGVILKAFFERGVTDNLFGLKREIQDILEKPIPQSVKSLFNKLRMMVDKADSFVMFGM